MSRTGPKPVRQITGDNLYNDPLIQKLINLIMQDGRKSVAQRIVYTALKNASTSLSITVEELITKAMENMRPSRVSVKRVVKGSSRIIPKETDTNQKNVYALRNLKAASHSSVRSEGISVIKALGDIIEDAYNGTGKAIELRKSMESAIEANKANKA